MNILTGMLIQAPGLFPGYPEKKGRELFAKPGKLIIAMIVTICLF